jgi:hypothetical protein
MKKKAHRTHRRTQKKIEEDDNKKTSVSFCVFCGLLKQLGGKL